MHIPFGRYVLPINMHSRAIRDGHFSGRRWLAPERIARTRVRSKLLFIQFVHPPVEHFNATT